MNLTYEKAKTTKETLEAIGAPVPQDILDFLQQWEQQHGSNGETPIYTTLKAHSKFPITKEKEDCVNGTVVQLLADVPNAEEPGLLLGKIQCGKTDTFENIIGLAFDRGIDITIVLTKGTKALVKQTISRMRYDYRFFKEDDNLNRNTTIIVEDIIENRNGFNRARVERGKLVIVAKKEATNLRHIINVFKELNPWMQEKKVLIVDDEADFASRNYSTVKRKSLIDDDGNEIPQDKEYKLAIVSKLIDEFRSIPNYCRYLQVTATPYCLFLQPDGNIDIEGGTALSFCPRFVKLVPVHDKYIGGKQYFVDSLDDNSMFSHLYRPVTQKCVTVLGHEDKRYLKSGIGSGNIIGLTYALVGYLMAAAIRRIQCKESGRNFLSSAVLHSNIDQDNHIWQKKLLTFMLSQIKDYFFNSINDVRLDYIINDIYNDLTTSIKKGNDAGLISVSTPSLDEIKTEIKQIFADEDISIKVVNSAEDADSLLDRESGQLRLDSAINIFIGANILDRGITINNMLCFFYGRNPKTFQQDTVLQHARFYGARALEDMAVTRLYTTDRIYRALVKMNELDDRLREWFLAGYDQPNNVVTCVGYDKDIRPCAMSKIKPSKVVTISEQKRFLPIGMNTGNKREIDEVVSKIDNLITSAPEFANQDADGFFEMDIERAMKILDLVEKTYRYEDSRNPHKGDLKEAASILYYCATKSNGKIWAMQRTNRNMSRIRSNGAWIDAPDDGRTDTAPSRAKATDRPVLMLLRQNGDKKQLQIGVKNDGTPEYMNIGWNNAAFYWPVVMTQANIDKMLFAANQKAKEQVLSVDLSYITKGLNPEEILNLTFKGDLTTFGKVGDEFEVHQQMETRGVRNTTAAKYFVKNADGSYAINPNVTVDEYLWADVYTFNKGNFPFVLRDYKYMLLRAGKTDNPQVMLLELYPSDTWTIWDNAEFDDDGYLIDYIDNKVKLISATDVITNKNGDESDFSSEDICQWVIGFSIKKILKLHNPIGQDDNVIYEETPDGED